MIFRGCLRVTQVLLIRLYSNCKNVLSTVKRSQRLPYQQPDFATNRCLDAVESYMVKESRSHCEEGIWDQAILTHNYISAELRHIVFEQSVCIYVNRKVVNPYCQSLV